MKPESLKISVKNHEFKGHFRGVAFKEGDSYIFYIPSLQLSSYGDTEQEAHEMMQDVFKTFSEDLFALSQTEVNEMLTELGWKAQKYLAKRRVHLSETTFEDIKREFNLPESTTPKLVPFTV